MYRAIGSGLVAFAAVCMTFATADDAEARHRRGNGSCGSFGGFGKLFNRSHHDRGCAKSYECEPVVKSCGSQGGSYAGSSSVHYKDHNRHDGAVVYGERGSYDRGRRSDERREQRSYRGDDYERQPRQAPPAPTISDEQNRDDGQQDDGNENRSDDERESDSANENGNNSDDNSDREDI